MDAATLCTLRRIAKKTSCGGRFLLAQRILRRLFFGSQVTVRIDDFDGDLAMDLHLWEHMQSRIFWVEYYNRDIVSLLNQLARENMVFVDIGANIGEITMVASKRVGPLGRVVAFEPVDRYADILETNVSSNGLPNVTLVRAGLSDKIGSFPIFDSCGQRIPNEEHRGLNSLYAGPGESPTQVIKVTTLDEYLSRNPMNRVDIVKIDIEGAELPCLRGAAQTLRKYQPYLIIEVQQQSSAAAGYDQRDILDYLSGFGYEFSLIGHSGKLRRINRDALFDYQNVLCSPSASPPRRNGA